MGKKLTTEEFIKKAKVIHGDRYDYSKVNYVNCKIKVTIICPEHGEFQQQPVKHHTGANCQKCVGGIKSNTKEFIKKAKKRHGDNYGYDQVVYVNNIEKIKIYCHKHGDYFYQAPAKHLYYGCEKCGGRIQLTTKEFIQKARKIHGDRYDYSKVIYLNNQTKVTIICPEHGEFQQQPNNHLLGKNCNKCSGHYMDTAFFVEKARKVHGDNYDYSKAKYVDNRTKVTIICSIHGEFKQIISSHLRGSGCPKCVGKGVEYMPFEEAREFAKKLKLKSQSAFVRWWEENEELAKRIGLPKYPQIIYRTYR